MALLEPKRFIEVGDPVILYSGRGNIQLIRIEPGKTTNGKHGNYPHDALVGLEFGSKVTSKHGAGFVHALYPSPELWSQALDHRTEILYASDISIITMYLELKPGMVVVESGTGSGSLSTAIARTVAPTGHLYTYEFHEQRAAAAVEDFKTNGLADYITVTHRDACADGFDPIPADAVFLDLPSPWTAIPHVAKVLRPNKRACSFSPCIEQVQRTCLAFAENGFHEIQTIECLSRPYDIREVDAASGQDIRKLAKKRARQEGKKTPVVLEYHRPTHLVTVPRAAIKGHSGFLTFARKMIPEIENK